MFPKHFIQNCKIVKLLCFQKAKQKLFNHVGQLIRAFVKNVPLPIYKNDFIVSYLHLIHSKILFIILEKKVLIVLVVVPMGVVDLQIE